MAKGKTKKPSPDDIQVNVPVTKQTAGGVTGAVIGGVIAGPVGALIGGVAGAMMGNRAAKGKSLVPEGAVETAKSTASTVKEKVTGSAPVKKAIASVKKAIGQPVKVRKAKSAPKAKPAPKVKPAAKSNAKAKTSSKAAKAKSASSKRK